MGRECENVRLRTPINAATHIACMGILKQVQDDGRQTANYVLHNCAEVVPLRGTLSSGATRHLLSKEGKSGGGFAAYCRRLWRPIIRPYGHLPPKEG